MITIFKIFLEGVGDKYAKRRWNIPDEDFVSKFEIPNETPYGFIKKIPVFKNPKLLKYFDSNVRAIGTPDGDLYVALKDGDFNHGAMSTNIGLDIDMNNFPLFHRIGKTNSFALGDSTSRKIEYDKNSKKILMKSLISINKKNPQYKFYLEYIDDVTNTSKPINFKVNIFGW